MSERMEEEATENKNATGVTSESLKEKLVKELEATHVEIEDMSGVIVFSISIFGCSCSFEYRRLRPDVRSHHRLSKVREEDDSGKASSRERRTEAGDRCDTCMDAEMLHA